MPDIKSIRDQILNIPRLIGLHLWQFICFCIKAAINRCALLLQKFGLFIRHCWPVVRERGREYLLLARVNKPIGIFLLLWPTLWALWIAAEGVPRPGVLLIFISGVVLMRSAGCVINDLADRDLDRNVERTWGRPLTSGRVGVKEAILLAAVLVVCAFLLVLLLNPFTIKLSFVAIVLAIIYPFSKRFTYLPQLFLGAAFGWAVPMAFAAQTNEIPVVAWILFLATVLWAMVYDTMYAMVDREYDIQIGIKSTAILFEEADRPIIAVLQLLVLTALIFAGQRVMLGTSYYAFLGIAAIFSLYQQYLIKDRIPENCFRAFLNNHWFGAAVFAGIVLDYYVRV